MKVAGGGRDGVCDGGGGVGAVRGHSECILALGWDDWGGRTPALPPNPVFF